MSLSCKGWMQRSDAGRSPFRKAGGRCRRYAAVPYRLPDVRRFRSFAVPFSDVAHRESVSRRRLIFGKRASGQDSGKGGVSVGNGRMQDSRFSEGENVHTERCGAGMERAWREWRLRPAERRDRMERSARIAAALSFRKMAARDGAVQRKAYRRVGRMPVLFCGGGRRRKISSHGRDMPQGHQHVRIRMHRACMRNGKCVLCIVAADDAKSGRMDNAVA